MAKMKGVRCIERNGTDYWYAALGGKNYKYCGKGDKGQELAEAARSKYVGKQYENREMAAGMKVKRSEFQTVLEMVNWYMKLRQIQKQKSYQRKAISAAHLAEYFGRKPLMQMDSDDLELYRQYRADKGISHTTINVELALLSAIYNLALKRKKILADMLPGQFGMVQEYNPRPIVTEDQYQCLLEAADSVFRDFVVCGYESAMRSQEICNLRAYQVHLDEVQSEVPKIVASYIDLGIFDTKTGARRTVPVSSALKKVLERRLESLASEAHVFTRENNRPWTPSLVSGRFKNLCKRAGLPQGDNTYNKKGERIGLVFHCLRHTRTTLWVKMGFSDEIIRKATGHKSLEAYQKYVKLDPADVMRLVDSDDLGKIEPDTNLIKTG